MNCVDGLVSVVTPLYNGEAHIRETIESVRCQTYGDWELLIIDDASTDQSRKQVEDLIQASGDGRIRLIINETNLGITDTRNRGIDEARGRYIAFLDSDDVWESEKLQKQLSFLARGKEVDPRAGFVFSGCRVIDEEGRDTGQFRSVDAIVTYDDLLRDNQIPCLTVLIDRSVIDTELIKMPHIRHEDYAAWLGILKEGYVAYGMQECLAGYRVAKKSASGNKLRAAKWHFEVLKSQNLSISEMTYFMGCYMLAAYRKRVGRK